MWYSVNPRLTLGVAHLLKQNAFRALGSYLIAPETDTLPSVHVSAGIQGIGTGNPGYSLTAEKNWTVGDGSFNLFGGVGYRSNTRLVSPVGGFKYTPDGRFNVGVQYDGINTDPFATVNTGNFVFGGYLIDFKHPAYMVGTRF